MLQTREQPKFFDMLIGVVTLDVPTFRRIEQDRKRTLQAAGVVGLVAIATAIGRISQFSWMTIALLVTVVGWAVASGRAFSLIESVTRKPQGRSRLVAIRDNLDQRQQTTLALAGLALLCLIVMAASTDGLGWSNVALAIPFLSWLSFATTSWWQARRFGHRHDYSAIARTVGFAHAPGLLAMLGFIPLIGLLLAVILPIWAVLTMVFAIRHTLGFTIDQALGTAILATSATAIGTAIVVILA